MYDFHPFNPSDLSLRVCRMLGWRAWNGERRPVVLSRGFGQVPSKAVLVLGSAGCRGDVGRGVSSSNEERPGSRWPISGRSRNAVHGRNCCIEFPRKHDKHAETTLAPSPTSPEFRYKHAPASRTIRPTSHYRSLAATCLPRRSTDHAHAGATAMSLKYPGSRRSWPSSGTTTLQLRVSPAPPQRCTTADPPQDTIRPAR